MPAILVPSPGGFRKKSRQIPLESGDKSQVHLPESSATAPKRMKKVKLQEISTAGTALTTESVEPKAGGSRLAQEAPELTKDGNSERVPEKGDKVKESKKVGKKRKEAADEVDGGAGSTKHAGARASDGDEKPKAKEEKQKKRKISELKVADKIQSGVEREPVDERALENFAISPGIQNALKEKGISSLFPIQAQTFGIVMNGQDLVARARTGQGKTLAFVLPILERLLAETNEGERNNGYGRPPRVIVLAPTRELAKQVGSDFETLGGAVGLKTICVYGGAPMGPQEGALQRGVDVVVGTPGRVKDFLQRGSLSLGALRFRVLDEADEMLNMGFVDDVEIILGAVEDAQKVQTLLFSATLPNWVNKIAERFLKAGKATVDLVGEEKLKASASVRHLLLPCHWTQRSEIICSLLSCYSRGGRVIVFCETKNDASALAEGLTQVKARALHGDIPQGQRETTLAGFRAGHFRVLVATDVAARGLDIPDVQLVVQCSAPKTEETYIHRSGRTGRAGNTGVSVMLTGGRTDYMIPVIERKAGVSFERISVPQPADIARASATTAAGTVEGVSDLVVPLFRDAAQQLVEATGAPPLDLLAKALAKISGHSELKRRSLLTAHEDATTLLFRAEGTTLNTPTYVFAALRRILPSASVDRVRRMTLTADASGAIFDAPNELVDSFLEAFKADNASPSRTKCSLEIAEKLPALQERQDKDSQAGSQGRGFGRGWGGGSNRRSSGGQGGSRAPSRGGPGRRGRGRGGRR